MTVDTPLTCYCCGETTDNVTIDMIGCIKKQEKAEKRFIEKFGRNPDGFLEVCPSCHRNENKTYISNIIKKYGGIYN